MFLNIKYEKRIDIFQKVIMILRKQINFKMCYKYTTKKY